MILSSLLDNPIFIIVGLVVFFGIIVLVVYLLRKYVKAFSNQEKKVDRETAAKQDLDRLLVPVEDEKTKAEMEKFNEEKKTK